MALLYDPTKHAHLIPSIAQIHRDCIERNATIATFLPPLDNDKMINWWTAKINEVPDGRFVVITVKEDESEATGVVMCSMPRSETGPFRGLVEKLLVSPNHRRKGLARVLMEKLEEVAPTEGITTLMLDTIEGSDAEFVYPRFGYHRLGAVPDYGVDPVNGTLKGGVWFWKHLPSHGVAYRGS